MRPGDVADEFAAADEVPVGDVLIVFLVAVDEVLEGAVPEVVLEAGLEGARQLGVLLADGSVAGKIGDVSDSQGVGVLVAVDAWSEGISACEAVFAAGGIDAGDGVFGRVGQGLDPVKVFRGVVATYTEGGRVPAGVDGLHGGKQGSGIISDTVD